MTTYYARIENGVVAEIFMLPENVLLTDILHHEIANQCIECSKDIKPSWLYDGKKFIKPVVEEITIVQTFTALSARQFWQAALVIGVTEEGLTADVSNPESPLYVEDDAERESVLIDIKKTTQFSRDHYLIEKLTKAKNIPAEQLNSLWQWASQIQ